MKKVLLATAFAAATVTAQAQNAVATNWFGEIGYTAVRLKATDGVDTVKASPSAVNLSVGYQVMPNLAIEGLAAFSLSDAKVKLNGTSTVVDADVKSTLGIYLRPSFKVTDNIELFGRLGYAHSKYSLSAGGVNATGSDSDFSYGIGANFYLNKTSYISGNWTSYYSKDGVKGTGVAVSYGVRF